MTEKLIGLSGVFRPDIDARINDPGSKHVFVERGGNLPRSTPNAVAHDIHAGSVVETDNWRVTAGLARHAQPFLDCLAYRVETDDAVVVFTGDTGPCPEVQELATDSDLLLCMCWDEQSRLDSSGATALGAVCGFKDAARLAAEAGSKQLVLLHSTAALDDPTIRATARRGIQELFHGPTSFAYEGLALRRFSPDGLWLNVDDPAE